MKEFRIVPLTLGEANQLVTTLHRHHGPLAYHLASIGGARCDGGQIIGAATLQRPCSRVMDDRVTIEVARLVTDGTANACSFLLGASARLAWSFGYLRIQTYTMAEESGSSMRAAGWRMERQTPATIWNRPDRPRNDAHAPGPRIRWAAFAPQVFARCAAEDVSPAFVLGQAAYRSGGAMTSNPFSAGEEDQQWEAWRDGWIEAEAEVRLAAPITYCTPQDTA